MQALHNLRNLRILNSLRTWSATGKLKKHLLPITLGMAAVVAVGLAASNWLNSYGMRGLVSGTGRIEATEVDVATILAGRVADILVDEGDLVKAGQTLAHMQIDSLRAQKLEAQAEHERALQAAVSAEAQVALRRSEHASMQATIALRQAEWSAAQRRLQRSQTLAAEGASSEQELDDDRARMSGAQASLQAARAQTTAAHAAIDAAEAQVVGAQSAVNAALATIQRIDAAISDSELVAPRDGRVQYRLAQPGEVIGAGGKVLNLVDLSDVYINIFLPESASGRVAMGAEVRLVLDIAPKVVIPAQVTFVSSNAQFTPKTVETSAERQKLMFKVKARISMNALRQQLNEVKTGLAGVAWIRLDPKRDWPSRLQLAPAATTKPTSATAIRS